MTILSQIDALRTSLSNVYNSIEARGGTVPQNKNVINLPNAINTIPSGGGGGAVASQYGAIYKMASSQYIVTTTQAQECSPTIVDWNKAYLVYLDASDPYMESEMGVQFFYNEDWEQGGWSWILNIASTGEQRKYTNEEMLSECGISVTGVEGTWCAFNLNVYTTSGSNSPLAKIEFASASDFAAFTANNIQTDYTVYMSPLGNGCWIYSYSITGIEVGSTITGLQTRALSNIPYLNYIDLSGATALQVDSLQPRFVYGGNYGGNLTFKVGNISASVAASDALSGLSGTWSCYGEKRAEWIAKFPGKLVDGGE